MNVVGEIKYFLGNDYAHLKFSETKESFSVDIIMVPVAHRGQGIGTLLLNYVISLADSKGKKIFVSARPIGQLNAERLEKLIVFYERHGFEVYDRGVTTAYMVRKK